MTSKPAAEAGTQELEKLLAYEHSNTIARLTRSHGWTEMEAKAIFREMLRFLFVRSKSDKKPISTPYKIDVAWHELLLHTRDYREFCELYFGRFIDHCPHIIGQPEDVSGKENCISEAKRILRVTYFNSSWEFLSDSKTCASEDWGDDCLTDCG